MKILKLITFFTVLTVGTQLIAGKKKKNDKVKCRERAEQHDNAAAAALPSDEELEDNFSYFIRVADDGSARPITEAELPSSVMFKTIKIWKTVNLSKLKEVLSKSDFEKLKNIIRVLKANETFKAKLIEFKKYLDEVSEVPSEKKKKAVASKVEDLKEFSKAEKVALRSEDLAWLNANINSIYLCLFPFDDESHARAETIERNAAAILGAPRITDLDVDNFIEAHFGEEGGAAAPMVHRRPPAYQEDRDPPPYQVDRDPVRGLDLDRLDLDPENRFPEAGL